MNSPTAIDMLIHVDHPAAKTRLATRLAECPGVLKTRIATPKPNLSTDFPATSSKIHLAPGETGRCFSCCGTAPANSRRG